MYSGLTLFPIVAAPFVGSFLATLALRLPRHIPIAGGRSHCPACGHVLPVHALVPLVSWLVQRGCCRHCAARISVYYPAVELAALGIAGWAAMTVPGWPMIASCVLGWVLLTLSIIDIRDQLLPDALTIPLAFGGVMTAWWGDPASTVDHILAAILGLTAAWLLAAGYERLRGRAGLGMGDVKLIAAGGAWTGLAGLPGVVLIGAVTGLVFALCVGLLRNRLTAQSRISFGPFLAAGTWLVWLYGPLTLRWPSP